MSLLSDLKFLENSGHAPPSGGTWDVSTWETPYPTWLEEPIIGTSGLDNAGLRRRRRGLQVVEPGDTGKN